MACHAESFEGGTVIHDQQLTGSSPRDAGVGPVAPSAGTRPHLNGRRA